MKGCIGSYDPYQTSDLGQKRVQIGSRETSPNSILECATRVAYEIFTLISLTRNLAFLNLNHLSLIKVLNKIFDTVVDFI